MKIIIAFMFAVAFVYAELPPNSYLPPPPTSRNGGGYSRGPVSNSGQNFPPQVISARNLGAQSTRTVNPFGRSNHGSLSYNQGDVSRNGVPAGYDSNAVSYARNALEQFNTEPANYNFGYMVNDYQEGTDFGHHEQRQEEKAQGEYHVVLPDGRKQTVSYKADERGFKPEVSYQESEDLARSSGYDSNANNFRSVGNHDGHFGHGNNGGHNNFASRSNGY